MRKYTTALVIAAALSATVAAVLRSNDAGRHDGHDEDDETNEPNDGPLQQHDEQQPPERAVAEAVAFAA